MNTTGNIQQADSGISGGSVSLSEYEIMMLATIIYCEAGNQGTDGQLAVGYVIMNRIRSSRFPNTLEGVLRQSKQFEPVGSGRFDLVLKAEQDDDIPNIVTQSCWNAARTVVNGTSNVGESLFFRTWGAGTVAGDKPAERRCALLDHQRSYLLLLLDQLYHRFIQ